MRLKNKRKIMIFTILILLIGNIFIINVYAKNQENYQKINKNTDKNIEITIYQFKGINNVKCYKTNLLKIEALELKKQFQKLFSTKLSGYDLYLKSFKLLNDANILNENIEPNYSISYNNDKFLKKDNDYFNPYFFGLIGLGWSYPFGSHSELQTKYALGIDVVLPFFGLFGATTFPLFECPPIPPKGPVFAGVIFGYVGLVIDFGVLSGTGTGLFGPFLICAGVSLFHQPVTIPPIKEE